MNTANPVQQSLVPAGATPNDADQPQPAIPSAVSAPPHAVSIALNPTIGSWLNNRWVIFSLLAIVGPLGLPALWLSPRFSRPAKVLTTVLFLLATVVFPLALAYYWLEIALRPLVEAFSEVHG